MTGPTVKVRQTVLDRAQMACERCGGPAYAGALHHRRPRGMGGTRRRESNRPANLMLLCGEFSPGALSGCHETVESQRRWARMCGWLVSQHQDPAEVPVLTVWGWRLLDDAGGYVPVGVGDGEASAPAGNNLGGAA